MPQNLKMKRTATILTTIFLLMSSSHADDSGSTICRSSIDELRFKELAGPNIQVLAVCPKKGIFFVELKAEENDLLQFKKNIEQSDLEVTKISTLEEKTNIGSIVLMVEFNY